MAVLACQSSELDRAEPAHSESASDPEAEPGLESGFLRDALAFHSSFDEGPVRKRTRYRGKEDNSHLLPGRRKGGLLGKRLEWNL